MVKYVFLVEERSMAEFLEGFLRKNSDLEFQVVPHRGKDDLKASVPRKLRGMNRADTTFVILVDQDSSDCKVLKDEFTSICIKIAQANFKVRIICRELEAWYLGDLFAVDKAFGTKLYRERNRERHREPDKWEHAKEYLQKLINNHGQIDIAKKMANAMTPESISANRSKSFLVFLNTLGLKF